MSGELDFEPCDPSAATPPAVWVDAVRDLGLHPAAWAWPVVRTFQAHRRGRVFVGVLRDGGRAVGLATARLHGLGGRRTFTGVADVDCLGCSALPGLALAGGLPAPLLTDAPDPALFPAAVTAFEAALRREYGRRLQAVVYRQVWRDGLPAVLRGVAVAREGEPVAVLRNRFADHDGYLRTLTRSRRSDQRRLSRRVDTDPQLCVRIGPASTADLDVDALYRLSRATARRNHRAAWPPLWYWRRELFATVLALPEVDVLRYTDPGGALIAAGVVYDHPVAPVLGPWGAHPPGPDRRSGLWFDYLDRLVQRTIAAGRPLLIAGKGKAGPKASLGFEPHRQWSVVRRLA